MSVKGSMSKYPNRARKSQREREMKKEIQKSLLQERASSLKISKRTREKLNLRTRDKKLTTTKESLINLEITKEEIREEIRRNPSKRREMEVH